MSLRKNLIALSLFNAATLLREQEEAAAAAVPAAPAPSAEGEEEKAPVDEQGNAITLDKMIARINIIRSGLSFEEPEVYGKLTTMFKGMTAEEKVKLYKQLTDISAIVQNIPAEKQAGTQAGEAPAAPAPEAAPPPAAPAAAPAPAAV